MRIIDIYQMEQEYIVGDGKNLQALKEKIETDDVLLKEIEEDFNQNPIQFKNEYINAKTNHLKNRYMYCWSFLKWYFDKALFSERTTFPDFQKEEMKKQGWMFPFAFINTRITTSGGVNVTTEELYIRNFNRLFDRLFCFNIGEKNSRIGCAFYVWICINICGKCRCRRRSRLDRSCCRRHDCCLRIQLDCCVGRTVCRFRSSPSHDSRLCS